MNTATAAEYIFGVQAGTLVHGEDGTSLAIRENFNAQPPIDNVICHKLEGEALKEALFIIDNIREHNMKIKWSSVDTWAVQYRRKHVCNLRIERDALAIGPVNDVLATQVKGMSRSQENLMQLIDALRDSIKGTPQVSFAMQ